jgi:anti-sigma B factor antagonist
VSDSQFSVAHDGSGTVVTANGQLDLAVTDELRAVLTSLTGVVTIDLSEVTFIDSSTIGVLVGAHNRLTGDGGELRLRHPQEMPRRVFEIVGLGDWIDD